MEIQIEGVVIIVGNYGSGKSEVAVNLAVNRSRAGMTVRIGDLDLVNPYFRTREARKILRALGVDVVLPPEQYLQADLPILSPMIAGMIRNPGQLALLDMGGDDVGTTVLAALGDAFTGGKGRMLQVVNPFRPYTDTVEGCLKMKDTIEKKSRMKVSGLIGNANLIDDTKAEDVYYGYDFVRDCARKAGLPMEFITVPKRLLAAIDVNRFACPVLPIERQLVPPWKRAEPMENCKKVPARPAFGA